jgi:hypothetical protein
MDSHYVRNLKWWRILSDPDLDVANKATRRAAAHVVTLAHEAGGYAGVEDHARILSGREARGAT